MNKRLLIIVIIAVISLASLVTWLLLRQQAGDAVNNTDKPQSSNTSFSIKNFGEYSSDVNSKTQERISSDIQRHLEDDGIDTTSVSGVVRDDSLQYSRHDSAVAITLLVDIPNIKRTYKISLGSDETTGEASLYILCPSDSERIYPAFECKDTPIS